MRNKLFLLLALLLAFWGHANPASATVCSAGCTQYDTNAVFSGSSVSVTLTGVVAGHGIHAWVCAAGPTAIASATVGGSAATIGGTTASGTGYLCGAVVFANAPSGSVAITVNFTGTCAGCNLIAEEWPGDATSSLLDGQNATYTAGGTATPLPCGNITTTNANDVVEAMLFQPQSATPAVPTGYAFAVSTGASGPWYSAYQTVSSTGTYNPTFTSGTNSFDNYNVCGGFEQAGSTGAVAHPRLLKDVGQ